MIKNKVIHLIKKYFENIFKNIKNRLKMVRFPIRLCSIKHQIKLFLKIIF